MYSYKQSGRWLDVLDQIHPTIDQTAYKDAWKQYHKIVCTSLLEDEHLDGRNMSKTLYFKLKP